MLSVRSWYGVPLHPCSCVSACTNHYWTAHFQPVGLSTTLSYLTATVLDQPQHSMLTFTVKSSCQLETLPFPSSAWRGIYINIECLLWNVSPSSGVAAAELGIENTFKKRILDHKHWGRWELLAWGRPLDPISTLPFTSNWVKLTTKLVKSVEACSSIMVLYGTNDERPHLLKHQILHQRQQGEEKDELSKGEWGNDRPPTKNQPWVIFHWYNHQKVPRYDKSHKLWYTHRPKDTETHESPSNHVCFP